jgi:CDP-paratose synthetase
MHVIITGATGFLGSHLLRALVNRGDTVTAIRRQSSSLWRVNDIKQQVRWCDTNDFESLAGDAIVHLATTYGRKGEAPSDIMASNVVFPLRLIECAAKVGTPLFINTDSFFNTRTELPGAMNHYTLSKQAFRESGARVAEQLGVQFVNMQLEHVYGPLDDPSKFVPATLAALQQSSTLDLTPGNQRRDFIYVSDVVAAFLAVLDHRESLGRKFLQIGVGTGSSLPVADFVALAHQIVGSATELRFGALQHRVGEIMDSRADTTVLSRMGWAPLVALADGIRRTLSVGAS